MEGSLQRSCGRTQLENSRLCLGDKARWPSLSVKGMEYWNRSDRSTLMKGTYSRRFTFDVYNNTAFSSSV
jgi:hypothetical protein